MDHVDASPASIVQLGNYCDRTRGLPDFYIEYLPDATLFDLTYNAKTKCSGFGLGDKNIEWDRYAYLYEWLAHATRQYLEAEVRMFQAQVSHNDYGFQNIMVVPSPVSAMAALMKRREKGGEALIETSLLVRS